MVRYKVDDFEEDAMGESFHQGTILSDLNPFRIDSTGDLEFVAGLDEEKALGNAEPIIQGSECDLFLTESLQDIFNDIATIIGGPYPANMSTWSSTLVSEFFKFINTKFGLRNSFPDIILFHDVNGEKLLKMISNPEYNEIFDVHPDKDVVIGYIQCLTTVMGVAQTPSDNPNQLSLSMDHSDQENNKTTCNTNTVVKRKRGRPRKHPINGEKKKVKVERKILWKFIFHLLDTNSLDGCLSWVDRQKGLFKFTSGDGKEMVARRWGKIKGHHKPMTYQKMARALRDYRKKNIMEKCKGKLYYKFRPAALAQFGK